MVNSEVISVMTKNVSISAFLPLLAVGLPFIGSFLAMLSHKWEKVRNSIVVITTLLTLGALIAMCQPVLNGVSIAGKVYKGIEFSLPGFLGWGINLRVDPTSLLVALVTSFVWVGSCIYALSYMSVEHARTRYYTFVLATLGADIGVLLAKDFFSLFLFFELLAICSFVLVVHEEDKKTMAASNLYNYFCVVGGLLLLGGIIFLYGFTKNINIVPMADLIKSTVPPVFQYLIVTMMVFGFGSKAGIFLCHVWLPEAHPIAPTPASALLSGVMIKAGAYGIIRTVCTLFAPSGGGGHVVGGHVAAGMTTLNILGYAVLWLGVITMFFGVINALISPNCKRMLAYHSVSQMGYIIFGIGVAAYLGADGAMGLSGALYHIVNHALFKATLFFSVGAVYFRTHELDMYKLGGLWRNMPFTCVCCFIAVCGIAGVPFFNGFASKTLLHHSAIEAIQHSAHYSATHKQDIYLRIAEIFFILTAFGTFCSNMKMWLFIFIWKRPKKYENVQSAPLPMKIALFMLASSIILIGLNPNWLLETFIGPALAYFNFNPSSHPYHIIYNTHAAIGSLRSTIPILYNPVNLSLFNPESLHNLQVGGLEIMGGAMYFIFGYRFGWFHFAPPDRLTFKYIYTSISVFVMRIFSTIAYSISNTVNSSYYCLSDIFIPSISLPFDYVSQNVNQLYCSLSQKTVKHLSLFSNGTSVQVNRICCSTPSLLMPLFSSIMSLISDISDKFYYRLAKVVPLFSSIMSLISDISDKFYYVVAKKIIPALSLSMQKLSKVIDRGYAVLAGLFLSIPRLLIKQRQNLFKLIFSIKGILKQCKESEKGNSRAVIALVRKSLVFISRKGIDQKKGLESEEIGIFSIKDVDNAWGFRLCLSDAQIEKNRNIISKYSRDIDLNVVVTIVSILVLIVIVLYLS